MHENSPTDLFLCCGCIWPLLLWKDKCCFLWKMNGYKCKGLVNKSSILPGFLFSYLCPCSSMAVPLRPPMSHMMMEWSELPEKRTLWTGSQQSAVTLPGAKHIKQHKYIRSHHEGGFSQHIHVDKLSRCLGGPELSQLLITQREKN